MIRPASDRPGLACDEHPDLVLDEVGAAEHLRTAHSAYWQELLRWRGDPARPTGPDRPPIAARRRRPRSHNRATTKRRK